jgi:allantoin racemase
MKKRILLLHPTTEEDIKSKNIAADSRNDYPTDWFRKSMQKHAEKVTHENTEVTQWFLDEYSGSLQNLYLATVNNLTLVNKIIRAEKEGFHAVVIGNHADSGVQMARSIVKIPVVGPCEASLAVGSFIGEKFVMLTIREQFLRLLEQNIRLFGFQDRFITYRPVRWPEESLWKYIIEAHLGKAEKLIEHFDKIAKECMKDGADTILVPGYPFGAALSMAEYTEVAGTGVSIVDGAAAALKIAESLAELQEGIGLASTRGQMSQYQEVPKG